jgi:hypothetical protein
MRFANRRLKSYLLVLPFLLALPSLGQKTPTPALGSVQGVVLDADGKPTPDAHVSGIPDQNFRNEISATTDSEGKFNLTNVPAGTLYVHAYKESDGYPNDFFAFYLTSDRAWIKVSVEPDKAPAYATIQLGPKAAYLKLDITDENGAPTTAELVFTREDGKQGSKPYRRSSPPASEAIMVPPVPFRLAIEKAGYDAYSQGVTSLKSGETLTISAHLKRSR